MIYLRLFWEFSRPDSLPSAAVWPRCPFLHDIGEATGWFTQAQLMNMLAVSESTPAPSASTWPPMWASPLPVSPAR